MKKGICIGSLPGDTYEKQFELAKDAGFEGVEFRTLRTDTERTEVKDLADDIGLELFSVMNTGHWVSPLSSSDPKVREVSHNGIVSSLDTAKVISADTVLIVPGVVNEQTRYEDVYKQSQVEVHRLIPKATEVGVQIAIENVWNKFLLSPIEFVRYIDEFESEFVSAYFDVGNICSYGIPQQWIKSLGSRISKVHLKGFNTDTHKFTGLIEDCTIDWNAVMVSLSDVGYNDYLTAELRGDVYQISKDISKIIEGKV